MPIPACAAGRTRSGSHKRTVLSCEQDNRYRPSGENATSQTAAVWPTNRRLSLPAPLGVVLRAQLRLAAQAPVEVGELPGVRRLARGRLVDRSLFQLRLLLVERVLDLGELRLVGDLHRDLLRVDPRLQVRQRPVVGRELLPAPVLDRLLGVLELFAPLLVVETLLRVAPVLVAVEGLLLGDEAAHVAPEAQALYESCGFRVWGREPRSLCHEGTYVTVLHLALDLD